ncbi:conserved hypothetical protein [Arthrobacter sp. 9AX]|nr:conserved hypothetical protein [Arthrobacter sp. 9AX]
MGDGSEGGGAGVAASAVVVAEEIEGDAEGEADDGATALGASGVQAVKTVSPAPTARKRAKVRRVVAASPGPEVGGQW